MSVSYDRMQEAVALVKQLEKSYLQELQTLIQSQIKLRDQSAVADAISEVHKIAERIGVPISDLINMSKRGKSDKPKKVLPVKYRHPDDEKLTWSGHGRHPQWVQLWADTHGSLEGCTV